MTARIGAGDTDLGRRIRQVQDLSERILAPARRRSASCSTDWSAVQRADARPTAPLLEEFRAAQRRQRQGPRAPSPGSRRSWREQLTRTRSAALPAGTEEGRLRDERTASAPTIGQGAGRAVEGGIGAGSRCRSWPVHRRMEAAEKALPGYAEPSPTRRNTRCAATSTAPRREERDARAQIVAGFPEYLALTDPKPLSVAATQSAVAPNEALVTAARVGA